VWGHHDREHMVVKSPKQRLEENQSNYEKSRHSFRPYKAEKDFKLLNLMKALLLHRENVQVIKPLNFYTFKSIIKNLFRRQ
jgi:hypothetical protein